MSCPAFGQYFDPREKAIFDFYYDSKTNSIDGSRILDGTVPTSALTNPNYWLRIDGSNTPSANISWGGKKLTNLWDGVSTGTAVTVETVTSITNNMLSNLLSVVEADFKDGATQVFTATAGYEVITNFAVNIMDSGYSATSSNVVIGTTGRYRAYITLAYSAGGASSSGCHLFTNNILATTLSSNEIGWQRSTTAVGQDGVVACEKIVYLSAGTIVDWRIDNLEATGSDTLTWRHGTVGLEKK